MVSSLFDTMQSVELIRHYRGVGFVRHFGPNQSLTGERHD